MLSTQAFGRVLAVGLVWLSVSIVVFAGSAPDQSGSSCDDRWSLLGIRVGMTLPEVRDKFPTGAFLHDQRGDSYYYVEVKQPLQDLDVHKARVSFWFHDSGILELMGVGLRGGAAYRDVVEYLEQKLGRANMVTSSTYRTWWGGLRDRWGVGWESGCGVRIRVERGRFDRAGLSLAPSDDWVHAAGGKNGN